VCHRPWARAKLSRQSRATSCPFGKPRFGTCAFTGDGQMEWAIMGHICILSNKIKRPQFLGATDHSVKFYSIFFIRFFQSENLMWQSPDKTIWPKWSNRGADETYFLTPPFPKRPCRCAGSKSRTPFGAPHKWRWPLPSAPVKDRVPLPQIYSRQIPVCVWLVRCRPIAYGGDHNHFQPRNSQYP